jgi:hypothetical protein
VTDPLHGESTVKVEDCLVEAFASEKFVRMKSVFHHYGERE